MRKLITLALFLAALSAFLAQPRAIHAQGYALATLTVAAAPDVWTPADLSGQPVYLYCYAGCSGAVSLAGIAPLTYYGAAIYYVIQAPIAAAYAAPYSAPVTYSTAYTPSYGAYGVAGGACVLGSYPSLYGCSSASYASPLGYGYGVSPFISQGCNGYGGYSCFGSGFGGGYPFQHFGNHVNESGETEPVCPAGQTEHEHGPFAEACH